MIGISVVCSFRSGMGFLTPGQTCQTFQSKTSLCSLLHNYQSEYYLINLFQWLFEFQTSNTLEALYFLNFSYLNFGTTDKNLILPEQVAPFLLFFRQKSSKNFYIFCVLKEDS